MGSTSSTTEMTTYADGKYIERLYMLDKEI